MNEVSISFRKPAQQPGSIPSPPPSHLSRTHLRIDGMTCGNCARHASDALQSVPGVSHASVDLAAATAVVSWKPDTIPKPASLLPPIAQAGFKGTILDSPPRPGSPSQAPNPWKLSLTLGIPAALILIVGDWFLGLGMNPTFKFFSLAIATPVVAILGIRFFRGAWAQLRAGAANMDTLVSLGVSAAMGYSVFALLSRQPGHLFFTESVTLLTLVGIGHFLESNMSARAGNALRALLELTPPTALRLSPSHTEERVPAELLRPADRILLKPGDRIPVDAQVLEGSSAVDESLLTGESLPVDKSPGSTLFAGTTNQNGRLIASVTATGEDTALSRIAEVIRRAQSTRASVQRLADRISSIFVPIVVLIAIAAAAFWILAPDSAAAVHARAGSLLWHTHLPSSPVATAVLIFCAVLVIACPCAMGLATPVALMAGVNAAAKRGILVRDAAVLETCGLINTILFDKTGTLTQGHPAVVAQDDFRSPDNRVVPLAEIAASLARPSNHPLSIAIARLAPGSLPTTLWTETAGAGVQANWWNLSVQLGSLTAASNAGVDLTPAQPFLNAWLAQGATPLVLSSGSNLWGVFALRDTLRPEAHDAIQRLRQAGFQVGMLSGDHPLAAQAVAREAGIDPQFVHAGVRPEGKADTLRQLRAAGRRVAFVGDGINDGPALAAADLGIAVARASDVAREAAGIVLLRPDLGGVADALQLAAATLRTIRQNLFWAFFYNAAAVPLAAVGLVHPALCAAAMGLSDLIVVGNALRLSRRLR